MGTGPSKSSDNSGHDSSDDREDQAGGQLYVSLKMENSRMLSGGLIPHVYGSVPLVGSWDSSKAVSVFFFFFFRMVFLLSDSLFLFQFFFPC